MMSIDVMYVGGQAWQGKWLSLSLGTTGSLSGNMCYFWALLEFLGAILVNPNPNHSAEGEVETTPYENVLRLTGRHFPMKIALQPSQNWAMKRCKVCYKKRFDGKADTLAIGAPRNLVCVDICFRLYHTKRKYWK